MSHRNGELSDHYQWALPPAVPHLLMSAFSSQTFSLMMLCPRCSSVISAACEVKTSATDKVHEHADMSHTWTGMLTEQVLKDARNETALLVG